MVQQEEGDVTAASRYIPCCVDPGIQHAPASITSLFESLCCFRVEIHELWKC